VALFERGPPYATVRFAVQAIVTAEQISEMAKLAASVHVDAAVLGYVSRLAEESRRHQHVKLGLSVRGCLAMVRTAQDVGRIARAELRHAGRHQGTGRPGAQPPHPARRRGPSSAAPPSSR